jgi:pilus assembly protein CpaC
MPTDGFKAATAVESLLGNMESDGVSGSTRPTPTAAPDKTTSPAVGAAEPNNKDRKARKSDKTAAASPAPGFNLK